AHAPAGGPGGHHQRPHRLGDPRRAVSPARRPVPRAPRRGLRRPVARPGRRPPRGRADPRRPLHVPRGRRPLPDGGAARLRRDAARVAHRPGEAIPMTLADLLADVVATRPAAVLVIDGEDDVRVTRAEFLARTVALRDALRERGVGRGDCVGVMLPNWSDALVWQFAAAAL